MAYTYTKRGGIDVDQLARITDKYGSIDMVHGLARQDGITSYAHGFGISGCQLEMLGQDVESAIRLAGSIGRRMPDSCERRAS